MDTGHSQLASYQTWQTENARESQRAQRRIKERNLLPKRGNQTRELLRATYKYSEVLFGVVKCPEDGLSNFSRKDMWLSTLDFNVSKIMSGRG